MSAEREHPDEGGTFEVLAVSDLDEDVTSSADCNGKLKREDRGNPQYAWWYLINASDQDMTTTIRRTWLYEGQTRSDTKQHSLYPREEREVFSFDRNQNPQVTPLACALS